MNYTEILSMFDVPVENLPSVIKQFENDKRANVKKLVETQRKLYDKYLNEKARILKLNEFENYYYDKGYKIIAGVDEVGRGPLAGPVVACVVILKKDTFIYGIDDSKKLSAKKRTQLSETIKKTAIDFQIGVVDADQIDEINILNATYKAMKQAICKLMTMPDILLNDYVTIPSVNITQHPIKYGDSKSISIACASVIAKVYRDELMVTLSKKYSDYDFENNKGYGTKKHVEAIKKFGICPLHRKSFVKNIV